MYNFEAPTQALQEEWVMAINLSLDQACDLSVSIQFSLPMCACMCMCVCMCVCVYAYMHVCECVEREREINKCEHLVPRMLGLTANERKYIVYGEWKGSVGMDQKSGITLHSIRHCTYCTC